MNGGHDIRHKRRRLQNAPPTAEDIAQSNATLQILTGRNVTWAQSSAEDNGDGTFEQSPLQPVTGPATTNGGAPSISTPSLFSGAAMAPPASPAVAGASHPPANAFPPPQQERPSSQTFVRPSQSVGPQQTALTMQTRHAPNVYADTDLTHGKNATTKMSADARSHMLARGGLPSPAPSDGTRKSPMAHVRTAPTISPDAVNISFPILPTASATSARNSPSTNAATAVSPLLSTASTTPAILQASHFRSETASHPSNRQPGPHGCIPPMPFPPPTQHSPAQIHMPAIPAMANSANSPDNQIGVRVSIPQTLQARQAQIQMPSAIHPFRAAVNSFTLLIAQKQLQFPPANAVNSLESGRLLLLSDALRLGDGICLIFHQLFCMASIRPDALIPPFNRLDLTRFRSMETLLGFNRDADRHFLAFCANFPEPLAQVYAGSSPQDDPAIQAVIDFLTKFPANWDYLRGLSERTSAPPLVQDLVDQLGMRSPVLQNAAFRSVTRLVKGITDFRSLACLDEIHRIDQVLYYHHKFRRNTSERATLYNHLAHFINYLRRWELGRRERPPLVSKTLVLAFRQQPQDMRQVHPTNQPPRGDTCTSPLSQAQQPQASSGFTSLSPTSFNMPNASITNPPVNPANPIASPTRQPHPLNPARLFPTLQETPRPQPTHPDPSHSALHQAHLRSPILMPKETEARPGKLYRYVIGFSLPPTKLDMSCQSQAVSFLIPDLAVELRPAKTPDVGKGKPTQLSVTEDSRTFRLRCSILPSAGFPSEADWVVAESFWPEEMYLEFNSHVLEKRRKLQHGKYLPIELTDFTKGQKDGPNILKVFLNRNKNVPPKHEYLIAVELIGFTSHERILEALYPLSAEESIDTIKKSLTSSTDSTDDDEIAVTSSSLTIKLFDPYSASKIFDLPVRGKSCLHRDCFDLETFLAMCKRPPGQGQPTVIDCWRCPLCRGDVRPQTLLVDGFLVKVREELARRGQLDTRAIVVQSDGSWMPKPEERNGARSSSMEHQQNTPALANAARRQAEIVDLD